MEKELNEYVEHRGFYMPKMIGKKCRLHVNPELEFIIVTNGCLLSVINGEEIRAKSGECCVIFPFCSHSFEKMSDDTEVCVMMFPEHVSGEFTQKYMYWSEPRSFTLTKMCYDYIMSVAENISTDDELLLKSLFYALASAYKEKTTEFNAKIGKKDIFEKIMIYLYKNRDKNIRINKLSEMFDVSGRTLNKMFEENIGIKPIEILNDLKINKACVLISEKNLTISEIAYECGFSSIRTFNRIFLKKTGYTPTEYKTKCIFD